jgi:hypothetical protein
MLDPVGVQACQTYFSGRSYPLCSSRARRGAEQQCGDVIGDFSLRVGGYWCCRGGPGSPSLQYCGRHMRAAMLYGATGA